MQIPQSPPDKFSMALSPLPAHLTAILNGGQDSRQAHELKESLWQHFQPFLTAKGYYIAWDGDNLCSPGLRVAAAPFSPKADEAFAAATAGRRGTKWGGPRTHPFLMGAYDRSRRFVVLKIVSSGRSEISVLQGLASPTARLDPMNHTIPVLEYLRAGDWTFIVMPAWELTLRECIPISTPAEFVAVAIQCLQGLTYLHRQRIAHLDIYASNILVNHVIHRPTVPFLTSFDFRLAYIDFEYSVRVPRTNPLIDVRQLPPTYHALPEVKAGRSHVNPFAADVFALGMVLKDHVRLQIEFEREHRRERRPSQELRHEASQYMALLESMTNSDPRKRPSIEQALREAGNTLSHL